MNSILETTLTFRIITNDKAWCVKTPKLVSLQLKMLSIEISKRKHLLVLMTFHLIQYKSQLD